MAVIISPNYLETYPSPLIFLAGPIQGTWNWQEKAANYIQQKAPDLDIASPRRKIEWHGDFTQGMYEEQVDWESFHLKEAGKKGVVLFWLANETEHLCERAYAQTTRYEFGEWITKHQLLSTLVAIGIDSAFSGGKYIKRRVELETSLPIYSTLEETCKEAIYLARLWIL